MNGTVRRGRISAAVLLGELREQSAVPSLLRIIQGNDDMMKMAALKALGEIGNPDAADAVAELGTDPSPLVRSSAATALRLLNDSRAVDVLTSMFEPELGTSAHTQRWAASQLAVLGAAEAISSIEKAAAQSSMLQAWRLRRIANRLRAQVDR